MRVLTISALALVLMACDDEHHESTPSPFVPCTVSPVAVDFGEADATIEGASVRTRIRVRNFSGSDRNLMLLPLGKPYSALPVPGGFKLPAGSTRDITVFFTPTDGMLHLDELRLVDDGNGDGKCELTVPLRGLGSGTLSLGGTPSTLDFGFMEPGTTQSLSLNVSNSTRLPVRLGSVNVVFDSGFSLPQPVQIKGPLSLTVPASGTLGMELIAAPQLLGPVSGRVVITSSTGQITLQAPFALTVGRPEPEVFPSNLTPWLVGFDPDSRLHGFSQRTVRFSNVGNSGPSGKDGLRLTSVLIAGLANTSSSELLVSVPPEAFQGLATNESAQLIFHLEPSSAGPKEFMVTLFTNAPDAPRVVVPVSANVEVLPRCEISISPSTELLLRPIPDGRSVGSVTFTNVGQTRCIVDDVRLTDGAENEFDIASDEPQQRELQPGEEHSVVIVGPRTTELMRVGALQFHVFNPDSRVELIDLYSTP